MQRRKYKELFIEPLCMIALSAATLCRTWRTGPTTPFRGPLPALAWNVL
jgi:hypothetical protein